MELSKKVYQICNAHFSRYGQCDRCPLLRVCDQETASYPGNSLEKQTAGWVLDMNEAAEEVEL